MHICIYNKIYRCITISLYKCIRICIHVCIYAFKYVCMRMEREQEEEPCRRAGREAEIASQLEPSRSQMQGYLVHKKMTTP